MPKYPQVKVDLVGQDGNAFAILGRCISAAKKAGLSPDQIEEFRVQAMSGDYSHLLATCMNFFDCDSNDPDYESDDDDYLDDEDEDEDEDEDDWNDEDWDNEEDDVFFDEEDAEDDYWDVKEDFEDEDD
jgi:hypothetical protein